VTADTVKRIILREDGSFAVDLTEDQLLARIVLLSTGVKDRMPPLPGIEAVETACLLRYCPVREGTQTRGKRIGVLGNSTRAVREAIFLRHFSDQVRYIDVEGRLAELDQHSIAQWIA
jgi:thioredoxin reductase (NADPH)